MSPIARHEFSRVHLKSHLLQLLGERQPECRRGNASAIAQACGRLANGSLVSPDQGRSDIERHACPKTATDESAKFSLEDLPFPLSFTKLPLILTLPDE